MNWRKIDMKLEGRLGALTTSVYEHIPSASPVGVMRREVFTPPVLWMELGWASLPALKSVRRDLDDLQRMLYAPIVYAEADPDIEVSTRFLLFVGFDIEYSADGSLYFVRRL